MGLDKRARAKAREEKTTQRRHDKRVSKQAFRDYVSKGDFKTPPPPLSTDKSIEGE